MDIFVKVENVEADSEFMDAQLAHSDEQIEIEESDVKQERLDVKEEWLTEDSVVDNVKNEDSAPPPDGLLKKCRGLEDSIKIAGYSEGNGVVHADTTGVKSLKSREHYWSSLVDDNNSRADIPRARKISFSPAEKELLVALIQGKPIIEDKRTDGRNVVLKKQAWEELGLEFSSQPYVQPRTSQQLRRCWENMKAQRKRELGQESSSMQRTGGGPPEGSSSATADNVVDSICPFLDLRVPGVIDSNSVEILDHSDVENVVAEVVLVEHDYLCTPSAGKRSSEVRDTPTTSAKKIKSEVNARVKRVILNIEQDKYLHSIRMRREEILVEREKELLEYERKHHKIMLEKAELELGILKNKNNKSYE